jgi:hypothetical protein
VHECRVSSDVGSDHAHCTFMGYGYVLLPFNPFQHSYQIFGENKIKDLFSFVYLFFAVRES